MIVDSIQTMFVDEMPQGVWTSPENLLAVFATLGYRYRSPPRRPPRGQLSWAKGVEHAVDCPVFRGRAILFSGIIRSVKLLWLTHEVGIFEMTEAGLQVRQPGRCPAQRPRTALVRPGPRLGTRPLGGSCLSRPAHFGGLLAAKPLELTPAVLHHFAVLEAVRLAPSKHKMFVNVAGDPPRRTSGGFRNSSGGQQRRRALIHIALLLGR